jgi:hypothetical protein
MPSSSRACAPSCVMGHQLLGDLFCERRIEPASDVDCDQFSVLSHVICF